ncbi:MAG: glycosyltransferase family 4 protein [Spirochaetes bacterium]|nr:glycosyltransferase family 4 protein [Spirochaetota bacterium]
MKNKTILIMASIRWYNASAHYALSLAESLRSTGNRVILFGIPGSPFVLKAAEKDFELINNINLQNAGIIKYLKNILAFRKFFHQNSIDIINPHFSRDQVFAFVSLAGIRKKIVRTRTDSKNPKSHFLNRAFYKFSAVHYTVPTKYMVSNIMKMGIPENKISVIPPGITYREFALYKPERDLKTELRIPKDKLVVSFVGRLDKVKGVEYLIRSYADIKNKDRFHLIISGEEINVRVEELKKIAAELKIDNISFLDRVDDVREILVITDIGVIPSIGSEAICRIGLEMLSFGIPVIGSNINSIPEIISDYGGIVVTPGSPDEIASALSFLAEKTNYDIIKKQIQERMIAQTPDRLSAEFGNIFSRLLEEWKDTLRI